MPFGLCNAPATIERLTEQVLGGLRLSVCLVHLDDTLVHGCKFKEEMHNLQQVFQRLLDANLKLSAKKCSLCQWKLKYSGHIVSEHGIVTYPDKVQAVQTWLRSTGVTDIKRFLGLCSY